MPVTTFLNDYEKLNCIAVSDKDVNELYQEVRKIDDRYLLRERIFIKGRFLRKPIITKLYTLYFDYLAPNSNWDIQIVSLGEDIFGENNTRNSVMCYFYGFLAGHKRLDTLSKPSVVSAEEIYSLMHRECGLGLQHMPELKDEIVNEQAKIKLKHMAQLIHNLIMKGL